MKTIISNDIYSLGCGGLLVLIAYPLFGLFEVTFYTVFLSGSIICGVLMRAGKDDLQTLMTMPISRKDYVKAKFAEMAISVVYGAVSTSAVGIFADVVKNQKLLSGSEAVTVLLNTLSVACLSVIVFSVGMAIYFKLDSLFLSVAIVVVFLVVIALPLSFVLLLEYEEPMMYKFMSMPLYFILPVVTVGVTFLMYILSCRSFEKTDL